MDYYVDCAASGTGDGTVHAPFRTIQQAAACACPGDTVIVRPGLYRESVSPVAGGRSETERIVYKSESPGKAVISGAEEITGWENIGGTVWTAVVPNSVFGGDNPYATEVFGDWYAASGVQHTGEVYFDGRSLYEAQSLEEVRQAPVYAPSWELEWSVWKWFAQVEEEKTHFYCNFHGRNPNAHLTEINVRRTCFYPEKTGINYITLDGFVICKAATNWAPPTACQEGMVGPHWSKGWIIKDCEIADSKCVGISLGKCIQPDNENKWVRFGRKSGTQNQRDVVCQAWKEGWDKDHIGGHVVCGCNIHHCEQAGIAGHLGGIFSRIENNHIHHINIKQLLSGAEIGGIKLHAAIDTEIRGNHIHHCTRGIWLDWEAQGTRITGNVLHDNVTPEHAQVFHRLGTGEDLFIEISHGPTTVDNNLFLSPYACRISSQGVAFVNNLFYGAFTMIGYGQNNGGVNSGHPRYTPYHDPHSTAIAGFMTLRHGDVRFFNNIFVQNPADYSRFDRISRYYNFPLNSTAGTAPYEDFPTGEEFEHHFDDPNYYNVERYYCYLPIYARGNVYFNGAVPTRKELDKTVESCPVSIRLEKTEGGYRMYTDLYARAMEKKPVIRSEDLGDAFESEARFEMPDGSDLVFDQDFSGARRQSAAIAGPFANGGSEFFFPGG